MSARYPARLQQVKANRKGVTSLEYAVIAGAMILALSVVLPGLAAALAGLFRPVAAAF